jgi:hypothetical protein
MLSQKDKGMRCSGPSLRRTKRKGQGGPGRGYLLKWEAFFEEHKGQENGFFKRNH